MVLMYSITYTSITVYIVYLCLDMVRGKDFRRSFSQLGGLRALNRAPFMALTASAPPDVEEIIHSSLHLSDAVVISQPLNRSNIFLSSSKHLGVKVKCIKYILDSTYAVSLRRETWED